MTLPKSMKTTTLLSSAVAGIVGSGWLLGPFACAKIAGPAAILSWPIGGLLIMIIATTFVLLTRAKPITGGTAQFFQMTYGDFAGYGFAWIAWLAWIAVSPIETMALIQYSANYLPSLMTHTAQPVLTTQGILTAIACLIFITLINMRGINFYSKINHIILAFKLFIPVATVIILVATHLHTTNLTAHIGFMPAGWHSVFAALPLAGVIYSFIGFNPVIQCAAETKNPRKSIPIAIFGALGICIVLYTTLQFVFVTALPTDAFKQGWSALHFLGDKGPFAGLLTLFGFAWFVKALYIDACISPFGTALVQSMATSRLTVGMSQCGYFPRYFLSINSKGTPFRALAFNTVIGFLFFLPFPSWQHMIGFLVSCLVLGYVIGPMSLMVIVHKNPDDFSGMPKVFIHAICIAALTICTLMIYWSGWSVIYKIILLFMIGYAVLLLNWGRHQLQNTQKSLDIGKGAWVIVYLLGLSIISYFGSFGGKHLIPFGMDFVCIALFSAFVYAFAYFSVFGISRASNLLRHVNIQS